MYHLPARNKEILFEKIRHYKEQCFPGPGGGQRLADAIGVLPQTVSYWLNGSRTPTFEQLYRLAILFRVSPLDLCGAKSSEKPNRSPAGIALLRESLNMLEHDAMQHVDRRVTAKTLNRVSALLSNGIEETNKAEKLN